MDWIYACKKLIKENKTIVEVSALAILVVIMVVVLLMKFVFVKQKEPPGAVHILYCGKCKDKNPYQIVDIMKQKPHCKKCGDLVFQLHKCRKCDFEFAAPPPNRDGDTKQYRNVMDVVESKMVRCPNCNSKETFPIPPSLLPKFDPKDVINP